MFLLNPLLRVLHEALSLYQMAVVIYIILLLLQQFGIINSYNVVVSSVSNFLNAIIDPALKQIRRVLPSIAGWDLSPIVLVFAIHFVQYLLLEILKQTLS